MNLVLVARREEKLAQLRDRLLESNPGLTIDVIAADLAVPGSAAELAATLDSLEFLTSGRQTSQQVVDTAMAALDKSTPTVVSGWQNLLLANGYWFTPRRVMLAVSERLLRSN